MLGVIKEFDMKRPDHVDFSFIDGNESKARFSLSPYERGFATTIGNVVRRLLLSSVQGHAIVAVYFDKINNEFDDIEGVVQETVDIVLNLKKISIALADDSLSSRTLSFDVKGKKLFQAKDLQVDNEILVGNPEDVIFEATEKADFSFEIQINKGWGYRTSEMIEPFLEKKGSIALDSSFSPVSLVSYEVKPVSIEGISRYEELVMTVETRGCITPEMAVRKAVSLLKECIWSFDEIHENSVMSSTSLQDKEEIKNDEVFSKSIYHGGFSVRTCFFLKINDILEIGQLVIRGEKELMDKPNFTDMVLEDIKENLEVMNLKLGMKDIGYIDINI